MIRSRAVNVIDFENQRALSPDVQGWVQSAKKEAGVRDFFYQGKRYVLISLGSRGNPGYQIGLENVEETALGIAIFIKEIFPIPGRFYPQVIAYPYLLVETEKPVKVYLIKENQPVLFFS